MNDYIGYRIKLLPNKEQIEMFNKYFGACRFVYNLSIDLQEEQRLKEEKYKFLSFMSLNNKITKLKNTKEYEWLSNYDSTTLKLVLKDSITAYLKFFNNKSCHPKYKSKKRSKKQFPIRSERLSIRDDHVILPSIGMIKCSNHKKPEIVGDSNIGKKNINYLKYTNPRISYDGLNYYLSFSLPKDENHNINSYEKYGGNDDWKGKPECNSIGIDIGCKGKNWIVDSAGNRIELPDFSKEDKKIKKLNKEFARKHNVNKDRDPRLYKDRKHPKGRTKNELKTIKKLNKYYKRISNKRKNSIYQYCKTLLELKPKSVVLEDIKTTDLLINDSNKECNKQKELQNKMVLRAAPFMVRTIISNTLESNGIPIIIAPHDYPSSQLCSNCGNRMDIGRKRIYRCPKCGSAIDRDYNASMNLASLGL